MKPARIALLLASSALFINLLTGLTNIAGQSIAENVEWKPLAWPCDNVERKQGSSAPGVDIRCRVRGGDGAPREGVINEGRKEVDGRDERSVRAQAPYRSIITRCGAHKEIRMVCCKAN